MLQIDQSVLNNSSVTVNKTEHVVNKLLDHLKLADVRPGDLIPKEMELVENLNVSRSVLREALSHLKLLGLIDSRKKRGMVLTTPNMVNALDKVLLPKLLGENTRQDLFELRLMLEVGIADALYSNITDEDYIILDGIVEDEQELVKLDKSEEVIEKLVAVDISFHGALYKITGNSFLQSLQKVLLPTIKHVMIHQLDMNPLSYGKISHNELLNILKSGTVNDFRLAMREHLAVHFSHL